MPHEDVVPPGDGHVLPICELGFAEPGEKPAVDFFSRGDYESPEEREARLEKQLVAHLIKVSEERETRLEQQLVVFLS